MTKEAKVYDFNFYKAIADKRKEQGRSLKDDDLAYRMARIRASIERIDKMMAELRQGPPSQQVKE